MVQGHEDHEERLRYGAPRQPVMSVARRTAPGDEAASGS
jgi:hypothetical protein